ncbi:uncharacterized protein LOC131673663 isoform X2 [Phymastichus coffea]|uniref:uncharacterized protein LOC131673663 isoform X2 n=1 Tax=Phymastichus coffea TaxID=108790 RepID=UPI00273B0C30|nr:uncharacterized protein LOC131673663 isoform X2 [Phymastichus coffea]
MLQQKIKDINAIRMWCGKDLGLCAENIAATVYSAGVLTKYSVVILKEKKMAKVYNLLTSTWSWIVDSTEKQIMFENAKIAKLKTIGYAGYLAIAAIAFTQTGMIPTILDITIPLNESRPKIQVVHAEYIVDQDEYFFEIYCIYCVVGVVSSMVLVSIDTVYTVVVHQNLAVFGIIKYRLHLATENPKQGLPKEHDFAYNTIISAIRLHQKAIEFNNLMENTFEILSLCLIIICVLFLSFGAITILENSDNIIDLTRMSMLEFGVVIHLLYLSWPGQLIISESSDLFVQIYTNKWYNISPRAKVLLQIMMLRCIKPSSLTAAGLYVMNFENYAAIIKSTMSYITVLASFRD